MTKAIGIKAELAKLPFLHGQGKDTTDAEKSTAFTTLAPYRGGWESHHYHSIYVTDIVENIEAEVCTECGERYFHATTLDELDRYLLAEHDVKKRIQVEIVSL
jgi:hypothetical protein